VILSEGLWKIAQVVTGVAKKGGSLPAKNRAGRLRLRTPALSDRLGRGGPQGLAYNRERNPYPFPAEPSGTQNTRKTRKGCGTQFPALHGGGCHPPYIDGER